MPFVIGSSVSLSGVFGSIVTSSHHSSLSPDEMCVINSGAPSLNSTATCWVRYTSMCRLRGAGTTGKNRHLALHHVPGLGGDDTVGLLAGCS